MPLASGPAKAFPAPGPTKSPWTPRPKPWWIRSGKTWVSSNSTYQSVFSKVLDRSLSSRVTKTKSSTRAVAAMIRSAGSLAKPGAARDPLVPCRHPHQHVTVEQDQRRTSQSPLGGSSNLSLVCPYLASQHPAFRLRGHEHVLQRNSVLCYFCLAVLCRKPVSFQARQQI